MYAKGIFFGEKERSKRESAQRERLLNKKEKVSGESGISRGEGKAKKNITAIGVWCSRFNHPKRKKAKRGK